MSFVLEAAMQDMRQEVVTVNGVELAYLEKGDGPTVALFHGFPDDAWTWSGQFDALTGAGYRVVAPFLRGYPPSKVPMDGSVSSKTNGADAVGFLRQVTEGPAHIVGHDWGGLATYAVLATAPELVRRATVVAVSHPATLLAILERPELVHHLFHIWFFQLEGLSEAALRANDFALVDYLWNLWTADGHDDAEHVARLKRDVFSEPGVIEALLPYYRALVRLPQDEPAFVAQLLEPTARPTLSVWGATDPARAAADGEEGFFRNEYRREIVDGAGHFVHREQPERFNELLLGWLAESGHRDTSVAAGATIV
jgi:pimeloyl-ACP methyl ester carboxylesterase